MFLWTPCTDHIPTATQLYRPCDLALYFEDEIREGMNVVSNDTKLTFETTASDVEMTKRQYMYAYLLYEDDTNESAYPEYKRKDNDPDIFYCWNAENIRHRSDKLQFHQNKMEYAIAQHSVDHYKVKKYRLFEEGMLVLPSDDIRLRNVTELEKEDHFTILSQGHYSLGNQYITEDGDPVGKIDNKLLSHLKTGDFEFIRQYFDNEFGIFYFILLIDTDYDEEFFAFPADWFAIRYPKTNIQDRQQIYKCSIQSQATLEKLEAKSIERRHKIIELINYMNSDKTKTKESTPMITPNFNAKDILDQNKDALLLAAKIEVGEAAVRQVSKIVKKQLPLMMKGYADLPIFDIIVANIVVMALKQFAPDNEKAMIIADAMLLAAVQKQMREFDFAGMLDEFIDGVDTSKITKLDSKD